MKNKIKITIAIIIILLAIFAFTSCDNDKENNTDNNTNDNNTNEDNTEDNTIDKTEKTNTNKENTSTDTDKKRIVFFHYWSGGMSGGINQMVKVFNEENSNYILSSTGLEHESFKISISESAENKADIYSYWAGAKTQKLVDSKRFEELDNMWESENLNNRFSKAIIDSACTYNGKKYLIPVTQHYVAFFYNKKMFTENNLQPPRTYEELIALCDKLMKLNITPIALGSMDKWPAQFWFDYLLLRTAGYEYREKLMKGEASYTDKEVKTAFNMWSELIKKKYFNENPNGYNYEQASDLVYEGKCAMTLMGTWIMGYYEDDKHNWKQGEDFDFFQFPVVNKDIEMTSLGPIDGLILSKDAQNKAASEKAMSYLSSVEPQKAMSKGSGALSPNIKIKNTFYTDLQQRIIKVINDSPNWSFNYDLASPPEVSEVGLKAFAEFLEFPDTFEAILENVEKEIKNTSSK